MPVSVFIKQLDSSSNNAKYANQFVQTVAIKGHAWPLKIGLDIIKQRCHKNKLCHLCFIEFTDRYF
jgi:hypothetical protein